MGPLKFSEVQCVVCWPWVWGWMTSQVGKKYFRSFPGKLEVKLQGNGWSEIQKHICLKYLFSWNYAHWVMLNVKLFNIYCLCLKICIESKISTIKHEHYSYSYYKPPSHLEKKAEKSPNHWCNCERSNKALQDLSIASWP